jgi:glycosyltransferase involved in cell wall biosynthesis
MADIDVVIPVYNEEPTLAGSVYRLHRVLTTQLPFSWRILIADNASTDATPEIAAALAETLAGVEVVHLEQKGRGRALRAAWSKSRARVVCYMDVDLSTDLRALLPLLAPLLSGHSELAIGTRLGRGARVKRGIKREFISRPTTGSCASFSGPGSPTRNAASRESAATCSQSSWPRYTMTAGSSTPSS